MPFSVMIWLVDREHYPSEVESRARRHDPVLTPGAAAGVTAPPAFDRLNYGFYETEAEADAALKDLARELERNHPVQVKSDGRIFLVPAGRVHYAVCEEVVRPKDVPAETHELAGAARSGG